MGLKASQLRRCLSQLASKDLTTPGVLPQVLVREARASLRSVHGWFDVPSDAVQDLVAGFLAHLVKRGVRVGGLGALVNEWLGWPDAQLVGTVRRVMRNLAVEESPHWELVRSLRATVQAVVRKGLPAPDAMPEHLLVNGRLASGRVAAACAWILAEAEAREGAQLKSVGALSNELMSRYHLGEGAPRQRLDEPDAQSPEQHLMSAREARRVAEKFLEREGLGTGELLVRRYDGEQLKTLAVRYRVPLTTVHARIRRACRALGEVAQQELAGPDEVHAALEVVRARVAQARSGDRGREFEAMAEAIGA